MSTPPALARRALPRRALPRRALPRRTAFTHASLLLATVAMLSACSSAPPSQGGSTPTAAPTPAPTPSAAPEVTITAGPVDTAMGLRAMRIDLLNAGTKPYTVRGYPAVRVLDDGLRPLDVAVLDGTAKISRIERFDGPPRRVTAAPGEHLAAVVVWRNTVADIEVPAMTGRRLEIAPGGGRPAQTVTPDGGIDLGTTGRLAVSAWTTPPAG
ncbi:DUF4232 domain-containing protein [Actinomadura sp. HBU206391]|uniref:DUF4232 domain-containing protein n=1 Tax=Actinomadura sp. HBU206391 TaxID=2731692 RepID=UPI001650CFF9|nr:DUF4232 domain-containing protein [Actinomadura sp. HBU206391]MBC6457835.1 DUF4232 domain-containing protein [Actinomadura sp. HBU206391]